MEEADRMAARCRSSKCTVERNGFKRELDTWRHKLINCVGFESILEGIYGPLLLRDLNIFDDCEPEELEDWAVKASCSFCSLLINDHVPVAASPSDDTPSQAPSLSDSSLSAHRFLHAVFHKKELASSGDPNVPLVAQELMKRMVRQFAMEYASKTRLTTTTGSPRSDLDSPLDLTVTRNQEEEPTPADSVLDPLTSCLTSELIPDSSVGTVCSTTGPRTQPDLVADTDQAENLQQDSTSNHSQSRRQQQRWGAAGAYQTEEHHAQRSSELSEGLLSKALRDVRAGEDVTSQDVTAAAAHGEEVRLVLQRVAAWAELGAREENGEMLFLPSSSSCLTQHGLRREGAEHSGENKQSRKRRGRYRQYNHDLLEEAITMVMGGRMSVSKAQVVYGIPHSTLEYKVKERNGTLKIPPKRRPVIVTTTTARQPPDSAGFHRLRD
ncbi:ligand-dependent nuclear receptor corepressor-like protein [Oncorhynchus masou masou]|uniref:ligand-dependent nuclear receptor corepressor-like protein n=1 Tax=Oncorhynchus masou masou TaxID=90313 RepID=UPI0031845758